MKAKRRVAALTMALVLVFGGMSVYGAVYGTNSARDTYVYPGKATVAASAFITESGWGKHRCNNTASIAGEDKDAAGTHHYQFYNGDNIYAAYFFGLGYKDYFIQKSIEGKFDLSKTIIHQGANITESPLLSVTVTD